MTMHVRYLKSVLHAPQILLAPSQGYYLWRRTRWNPVMGVYATGDGTPFSDEETALRALQMDPSSPDDLTLIPWEKIP